MSPTAPTALGARPAVPNLGAPPRSVAGPEYSLGNGDVIEVQIAGRLELTRVQVIVDPEGVATIPTLGSIPVGGLTLLEANRRVAERAHSLLRFADVSIAVAIPRSFEVVISGEVERPGTVQAMATQRLHELILVAGGITPRGSVRHLRLTQGASTREIDLLRFELADDLEQNPYAVDGMRIHVPPRAAAVTLAGAVRRPGEYEVGSDRDRAGISGPKQRVPIDRHQLLVDKDESQNIVLQNGDVVTLPVVEDKVYVVGEVKAPGAQDFRPDLTPREYVALAGGPGNRAKVASTTVTFRNGRTYAMGDAPSLEPGAVVTVPEVAETWPQDYVQIAQAIASLVTAYTGFFIIFNGPINNN